jgi:hypothetical protein
MTSSASSEDPKRASEIAPARVRPTSRPAVAIPIVNQKEVRTTRRRAARSSESK